MIRFLFPLAGIELVKQRMGCGNSKAASEATAPRTSPSQPTKFDPPAVKSETILSQRQEIVKKQDISVAGPEPVVRIASIVQPEKPPVESEDKSSILINDDDHVSEISVHLDDMSEVDQIDFANSPERPAIQQQQWRIKGDIDFQQYLNWPEIQDLQSRYPELLEDEVLEIFEVMDTHMDGYISHRQGEDIVFLLEAKLNPATAEAQPLAKVHVGNQAIAEKALTEQLTKMNRTAPPPKTTKAKKPIKFVSDTADPPSTTLDDFSSDWIPSAPSSSNPPVASISVSKTVIANQPAIKKGFLMQTAGSISPFSPPNSPSLNNGSSSSSSSKGSRNRYHVLDAGVLFHLDSHSSTPPFTFDRRGGVDLKDRTLFVRPDGVLELSKDNSESAEDVVSLCFKGEDERKEWIGAIKEHLIFAHNHS